MREVIGCFSASLEPRDRLLTEDPFGNAPLPNLIDILPGDVPSPDSGFVSLVMKGKDRLVTEPILEVGDINLAGLIAGRRWRPAVRGVVVLNRQKWFWDIVPD